MKLHPLTHIIVVLEVALLAVMLPSLQGALIIFGGFIAALLIPNRTEVRLAKPFLKILAVAAFFLFLMHGVTWKPPSISHEGIINGFDSFIHIAVPVTCVLYLSRRITSEELLALLIDIRIPPAVILILFRTLWLVPRLMERMDAAVTAQKLRGMRVENTIQRAHAILPTLSPIFSSMFDEISQNSIILTTRGFLRPGRKTHLLKLRYRCVDAVVTAMVTGLLCVVFF